MKHQTLTVENSRIRVTVSREIADKSVIPHLILLFSVLDGDRPF